MHRSRDVKEYGLLREEPTFWPSWEKKVNDIKCKR